MDKIKIGPVEKDILTEVGSICAGNATTALVQILGRRIELLFPTLKVVNINKLPLYLSNHPEEVVIGIHMQILGEAKGNALLVFLKRDAFMIVDLLMGPVQEKPGMLTEIGISALKEMGNIVISAYLSSLSAFTGISAFPSTVTLTSGAASSLVNLAFVGIDKQEATETILVDAVFKDRKRDLSGNFFIIFDARTIKEILKKTRGMVKQEGTDENTD
ncbi:MAG: chemotaxis protein CheC [Candidatus Omnitrophica bacterium]|nr:chemotaxis protein CheC [Candidatus Omnitrophota bacterium]